MMVGGEGVFTIPAASLLVDCLVRVLFFFICYGARVKDLPEGGVAVTEVVLP